MEIEIIREFCNQSKIKWSSHCLERMQERDISRADVKNCLEYGEIRLSLSKLFSFWIFYQQ